MSKIEVTINGIIACSLIVWWIMAASEAIEAAKKEEK